MLQENETKTMVLSTKPDTRQVCVKENNFDDATKALVDQSRVNGVKLWDWLTKHRNPQEVRKACLLNILTKLAATRALTTLFTGVHLAAVDRIYASAVPNLLNKLEDFVGQGTWVAEGRPKAAIHQRVVTDALRRFYPNKRKTENDFTLRSYRQGGRNCLQIVVAQPAFDSSRVFTDLDIDLGNPLWDLEGFFVHLGELLDTGYTDHFALRSKLVKAGLGEYMFYDIKAR